MERPVRIGTRRSELAMVQSRIIAEKLAAAFPGLKYELVGIKTKGDVILDKRLDLIGGKGLFVSEIENALIEGSIDMAVHSMKDMPALMPEELCIAAVSEREDPRDVLVTPDGFGFDALRKCAVIGTSSVRREVQLKNLRSDLNFKQLRGNVPTRLDKLMNGEYDAVVLAAAGLIRLGLLEKCKHCFSTEEMLPAAGQGILGVQARKDGQLQEMLGSINCRDAELQLRAERAFLTGVNGGCSTPVAAYAAVDGNKMRLSGMLATDNFPGGIRAVIEGEKLWASELGEELARLILKKASEKFI